mgnify:CR=1 FL=1
MRTWLAVAMAAGALTHSPADLALAVGRRQRAVAQVGEEPAPDRQPVPAQRLRRLADAPVVAGAIAERQLGDLLREEQDHQGRRQGDQPDQGAEAERFLQAGGQSGGTGRVVRGVDQDGRAAPDDLAAGGVDCGGFKCRDIDGIFSCNTCAEDNHCSDGYYCQDGACSRKPRDAGSLYVSKIGPDRERGPGGRGSARRTVILRVSSSTSAVKAAMTTHQKVTWVRSSQAMTPSGG